MNVAQQAAPPLLSSDLIEKFRAKYGDGDVKKYYSKFDVAVHAELR